MEKAQKELFSEERLSRVLVIHENKMRDSNLQRKSYFEQSNRSGKKEYYAKEKKEAARKVKKVDSSSEMISLVNRYKNQYDRNIMKTTKKTAKKTAKSPKKSKKY